MTEKIDSKIRRYWEDVLNSLAAFFGAGETDEKQRAASIGAAFSQIDNQLWNTGEGYLVDVFIDSDDTMFALISDEGSLYRANIVQREEGMFELDEKIKVIQEFVPVEQTTSMKIYRTTEGQWRWLGISSVATLNRDAEIDSRDLYDSFIEYVDRTGEYPQRDFMHMREDALIGQCDFIAREGYALITSGHYFDNDLAKAEIKARQANPEEWGDSIEFLASEEDVEWLKLRDVDVEIPVYKKGVCRFITTAPENEVASILTNHTQIMEVKRAMTQREKKALIKLFGGDEAAADAWLEANPGAVNRIIEERDMIRRNVKEPENDEVDPVEKPEESVDEEPVGEEIEDTADEEPVDDLPEDPEEQEVEVSIDEVLIAALSTRLQESELISGLQSRIVELETALDTIQKGQNEILAASARHETRLKDLELDEEQKRRTYIQDLPRRQKINMRFSPREERKDENDGKPEKASVIAEHTLSKIP